MVSHMQKGEWNIMWLKMKKGLQEGWSEDQGEIVYKTGPY